MPRGLLPIRSFSICRCKTAVLSSSNHGNLSRSARRPFCTDGFNQVAAFYFDVIAAHEKLLDLSNKEALTALEKLTHITQSNPTPVMPLEGILEDIPAMFRRAAINAAMGSARSFYSHLNKWRKRKEKAEAREKKFHEHPPVPPRTWNKSAMLYAGMWKEREASSIVVKVWTGACWSWIRVRITGRE